VAQHGVGPAAGYEEPIAWISWTPSQELHIWHQPIRYSRSVSNGPCLHICSCWSRPGRTIGIGKVADEGLLKVQPIIDVAG
jgi:hypothetical protein